MFDLVLLRPASASALTLGQFACWYRPQKKEEEQSQHRDHEDVPVVTPADFPPLMEFTVLPIMMELTSGVVVKKMMRPVVLNWGPQDNNFSRLMLFQVV